jgi:hypothetical protein
VLAADIVGVEREQGLVRRHAGCTRVELDHEEVVDVSRGVFLETELVGEVDEDVFDLLL